MTLIFIELKIIQYIRALQCDISINFKFTILFWSHADKGNTYNKNIK